MTMIDDQGASAQPCRADAEPPVESSVEPPAGPGVVPGVDEFRGVRGAERDRVYMVVECEVRRLRALQAAMLAEVQSSSSFLDDCHHSTHAWLQAVTNTSRASALHQTQTARMLSELPVVAAAAATGALGVEQLSVLTRLHGNERCRAQLPDCADLLSGYAATLTWREFAQVCQRWQAHADPDGCHRDHEASRTNRFVRSTRIGAGHLVHAEGDALSGEIITGVLDTQAQIEFAIDVAERLARYGVDADKYPLARSSRQRRYDAFFKVFLKAADTTKTTNRVPLVNIVCTETVLTNAIRALTHNADNAGTGDPAGGPSPRMRLCETVSGAPVDPHDLAIAALIGHIRRVVVDSTGRVIDLGRRRRLFTGATREAVLLNGDHCSWPGCETTTGIHIDHLTPWAALHGATNPLNGAPTCPHHNRDKHDHHITVTRNHTGWHHHRPNGTEIAPRTRDGP
ncbi:MAG: DUF222 domain-containing protein [Ilumatobacteraceae bacterium]